MNLKIISPMDAVILDLGFCSTFEAGSHVAQDSQVLVYSMICVKHNLDTPVLTRSSGISVLQSVVYEVLGIGLNASCMLGKLFLYV